MKKLPKMLLIGASLCPALGGAVEPMGVPDFSRGDAAAMGKGRVENVGIYVCPSAGDCVITVLATRPPGGGDECTFALTGDDKKPFFFIYRHQDRKDQDIVWNLVATDQGWAAEFVVKSPGRARGITFGEGGDKNHVAAPSTETATQHRRNIKSNQGVGNGRRSLLLYDIDVRLTKGTERTECKSFGPGIINRG